MTFKSGVLLRTTFVALGITSIYQLWLLAPFVSPARSVIYHWSGPLWKLYLPLMLDFCLFWLVVTVVFLVVRTPGRVRASIWCGALAMTPWMELRNWASITDGDAHWASVTLFAVGLLGFLLPLALWRPSFAERFEHYVKFASTVFLFSAVSGTFILCQIAWYGWLARSMNANRLHPVAHAEKPRVIWIVFDELSYDQIYERRFPGIELPAFDALAAQANVFTHMVPAGIHTEKVISTFITGRPVERFHPSSDERQLSVYNPSIKAWEPFNEHDSVFQDARNLNYTTAATGWFLPYCRILSDVLDKCFWSFNTSAGNMTFPQASLLSNMVAPWLQLLGTGSGYRMISHLLPIPSPDEFDARQHILDYVTLADASDRMLDDRSAGFTYIHLPIPHPGGIYDRRTGKFVTKNSSYIDNLVLADKLMGGFESRLKQSGQWDSSTLLVMGDHSWRTSVFWALLPDWTHEDQVASHGGQWDNRQAYVLKLPNQMEGARVDAPFNSSNTRKLLDALLAGRIRTADELSAWVKQTTAH